nr:PREDICTED: LOW QUALITY PROTEIN: zinc finger and BTB domain-containing protein 12-like [Anolis carolinensis]|eukprot:XP_008122422.2 PREDICTED: LOW QUALITY PROTEIN: zinc finger and BTB domain-containing protein 12-like [Anolis carolinensis]
MAPACEERLLFRFPGYGEGVLRRMDRLREQRRFCDVTVRLGGLRVPGHRVVFAAGSPFLRERFLLSEAPEVRLSLAQGPEVGRRLLLCCYTGRLEVPLAELAAYLSAASSLQMGHVAERCAQALSQYLAPKAGALLCGEEEDSEEEEEPSYSPFEGAPIQGGPSSPALSLSMESTQGCLENKSTSKRLPVLNYVPHWHRQDCMEEEEEEASSPFEGEFSKAQCFTVESNQRGPSSPAVSLSFLDSAVEITRSYLQGCYQSKSNSRRSNCSPHGKGSNGKEKPALPLEEKDCQGEMAKWGVFTQHGPSLAMELTRSYGDKTGPKRLPSPHTLNYPLHRHGGGSWKGPAHGPKGPFRCPRCGRPFQQLGPLASHVREHKLCLCLRCGKAFSQKANLTRHSRVHTGVKPFQCPVCRKRFTQKATLQDHLNLHRGLKPHRCNYCAMRFAHKPGLRRHLKEMHGKSTIQNSRQEAEEEVVTVVDFD